MYCEMGDVFLFSLTIQPTYVEGACTNGTSSYITILKVWYTSKTRCTLLPASHCTIDNCCVDYVSITHGDSTREHICMDVCSWSNWNQSNIQLSVLLHGSMFSTLIWPTVGWMDFQWTFRVCCDRPNFPIVLQIKPSYMSVIFSLNFHSFVYSMKSAEGLLQVYTSSYAGIRWVSGGIVHAALKNPCQNLWVAEHQVITSRWMIVHVSCLQISLIVENIASNSMRWFSVCMLNPGITFHFTSLTDSRVWKY